MELSLDIIRYCAEEVERQQDSPTAVSWMVNAWCRAMEAKLADQPLTVALVEYWGTLVEPHENEHGFRRTAVRVGRRICPDWQEVPKMMSQWAESLPRLTPDEAYRDLLLVHPFRDGNGRAGKLVLNYLSDTLSKPIMPSNWFHCANP